ncbi:hypothetical protein L9F63_017094 [Diploptera punctata]|uniref:Uncharacterized protein n=1 Tax=Diploptera punctata TaxID=6984 RepID=A0AAD8A1E0_DIPPU|nr:hypothetical protein L9F63_017094 [Diploptera punctata]
MEKKRRARINQSLNELKKLILDDSTSNKEGSKPAKLEKADILELTVQHLQKLHKEKDSDHLLSSLQNNPKFQAGFTECAREAHELLNRLDGVDPAVSDRLSKHLTSCLGTSPGRPAVLTLLPTKLPNGDLAFVIPANLKNVVASSINIPHKEVDLREDTVWRPW